MANLSLLCTQLLLLMARVAHQAIATSQTHPMMSEDKFYLDIKNIHVQCVEGKLVGGVGICVSSHQYLLLYVICKTKCCATCCCHARVHAGITPTLHHSSHFGYLTLFLLIGSSSSWPLPPFAICDVTALWYKNLRTVT